MECMLNRRIIQEQGNDTAKTSKITLTSNFPEQYGGLGIYAVNPDTGKYTDYVLSAPGKLTVETVGKLPFVIHGWVAGSVITLDSSYFASSEEYFNNFSEFDFALSSIDSDAGIGSVIPTAVQEFFTTSTTQLFIFPSVVKDFNFVYNFEE